MRIAGKQENVSSVSRRLEMTVLALVILAVAFCSTVYAEAHLECEPLEGTNVNMNNYSRWASPAESYLQSDDDGYMRVQGNLPAGQTTIVYYDKDFKLQSRKVLAAELPVFGGFYDDGTYFYLVTGQNNPDSDEEVEVIRITKYDRSWNRLSHCSQKGANTCYPFDAGSVRMDHHGDTMVVHTAHEMYSGHQANMTLLLNTSEMSIRKCMCLVSSYGGYVSHSFNQFVRFEDGKITTVDHGDAYPRAIQLTKYTGDPTSESFSVYNTEKKKFMSFEGKQGNNTTGASVGAYEISSSSYLIAGNQVNGQIDEKTRNVFVAAMNKASGAVKVNKLTEYSEGEETTTTPHMVNVAPAKYMVLWGRGKKIQYCFVDGNGDRQGSVYEKDGTLSDCAPILKDGSVEWYTWKGGSEKLYSIPVSSPDSMTVKENNFGHVYEYVKTEAGLASFRCTRCGDEKTGKVPISFNAYWRKAGSSGYYYGNPPSGLASNDGVEWYFTDIKYGASSENTFLDFTVETSDPENCTIDKKKETIWFKKAGRYTITVYPTYNPEVQMVRTIEILKPLEEVTLAADPAEGVIQLGNRITLTASADGGKGTLSYTFRAVDKAGNQTVLPEGYYPEKRIWCPEHAGEYLVTVEVEDSANSGTIVKSLPLSVKVTPAQCKPKSSNGPEPAGSLTYGEKLSQVVLKNTDFVDSSGNNNVAGTFQFDEPERRLSAGTHQVAWTFTPESGDYLPCTGTMNVTVKKADPEILSVPSTAEITYDPAVTLENVSMTGGQANVAGEFQWKVKGICPAAGTKNYAVVFLPEDGMNFNRAECEVSLQVRKAVPVISSVSGTSITYGQKLNASEISGTAQHSVSGVAVSGSFAWENGKMIPPAGEGNGYRAVFTPEDSENYSAAECVIPLHVKKAQHPRSMPEQMYTVAYTAETLSQEILSIEGWSFREADLGKALAVDEDNTFTMEYQGADAANFEITEAEVIIRRGACTHEKTETRNAKKEKCTEEGWSGDIYCKVCGALVADGHVVPASGHKWDKGTVTREATLESEGIITYSCVVCGAERDDTIPKMEAKEASQQESQDSQNQDVKDRRKEAENGKPDELQTAPALGENPNQKGTDGTALGQGASAAAAEKAITGMKNDTDPAGSVFSILQLRSPKQGNSNIRLSWKKAKKAERYVLYGNACGKKNRMRKLSTMTRTSYNVKKAVKKLRKGTYYKFLVVAIDHDNNVVSASKIIHVATKGGKVGNHKSLNIKAKTGGKTKVVKTVTIKRRKSVKLMAAANPANKKQKVKIHRAISFESTDPTIATVDGKGVVRGKKNGGTKIFVYTQDGICKVINVRVK